MYIYIYIYIYMCLIGLCATRSRLYFLDADLRNVFQTVKKPLAGVP